MLKLALDLGPLVLFFLVNAKLGIFCATGVFMVAVLVALVVSYALIRRLPVMTVVSAFIVVVFGGLTIVLQNETFIKLKPTIIYLLFAGLLLGGLVLRKPLLEIVFDQMFHLTEEGWRKLTVRWAVFFPRAGGPQRNRLAQAVHRFLGRVQGVRRAAADLRLRDAAGAAAEEIRRAGSEERLILWSCPANGSALLRGPMTGSGGIHSLTLALRIARLRGR